MTEPITADELIGRGLSVLHPGMSALAIIKYPKSDWPGLAKVGLEFLLRDVMEQHQCRLQITEDDFSDAIRVKAIPGGQQEVSRFDMVRADTMSDALALIGNAASIACSEAQEVPA